MSIVDKVKKRITKEISEDIDKRIDELGLKFDEILKEIKEMNKTLRDIKEILERDK